MFLLSFQICTQGLQQQRTVLGANNSILTKKKLKERYDSLINISVDFFDIEFIVFLISVSWKIFMRDNLSWKSTEPNSHPGCFKNQSRKMVGFSKEVIFSALHICILIMFDKSNSDYLS